MNDRTTTAPTAPTPPPGSEPSEIGEPRSGAALQALAAGIGVLAGMIVGVGSGLLVTTTSANSCSPSDGWCGLGALVAGLFVGVLSAAIAYVVAGTVVIFRHRPIGRRAVHIAIHIGLPAAGLLALTLLGATMDLLS